MADVQTDWGGISQRTAAWVIKELLERAIPLLVLEKFGQVKPIPANTSDTIIFRRYNKLDNTPKELVEGVTPDAVTMTSTDIQSTLVQYGEVMRFSDKVVDMCEDPVLKEATMILSQQAAEMIENVRWGKLLSGTNVVYGNGTARAEVNTKISKAGFRAIIKSLKRQDAKPIYEYTASTPAYGTESTSPTYVVICHTDLEGDLRDLEGFIDAKNYGTMKPMEGEIGSWESLRFITTTLAPVYEGGGAAGGTGVAETGGLADVYPMLVLAQNAYGIVPFKGANAVSPTVVPAKPSDSDPLAQRTKVGWKTWQTCVILNDAYMQRYEVAASV